MEWDETQRAEQGIIKDPDSRLHVLFVAPDCWVPGHWPHVELNSRRPQLIFMMKVTLVLLNLKL